MPKTIRNVFDKSLTFENLVLAHYRAVKGKRNKREVLLFEEDLETNIANIMYQLETGTYKLGKYRTFKIYEPKERIIKSLPYKDRVVHQWYVHEFIKPYFLPRFIKDTYACIDTRGTHLAAINTQKYMRDMYNKYKSNYYVLKCDIKKYFYSIDKDILYSIMKKHISDYKLLNLTSVLIYDNSDPKSIPIGNYTSQFFANIYLNELDQFIKKELKVKYYVRYMDDFCLLLPNKEICQNILNSIKIFLKNNLKLEVNSKTHYYPSKFGVNFCGYIIKENKIILRKTCIKNIKRKLYNEDFDLLSFKGHLKYASSNNFIFSILKKRLKIAGIKLTLYTASKLDDLYVYKNLKSYIRANINLVKYLKDKNYLLEDIVNISSLSLNDIENIDNFFIS